jgi:ABC-type Fe3+-citrate transport system substrate-binding protein
MKKQLVIIGIIAILITVELSGCSTQNNNENQDNNTISPEESKFVGTWKILLLI